MKLDGHAKLTNNALINFHSLCSQATSQFLRDKVCQIPQFNTLKASWADPNSSNKTDNDSIALAIATQELLVMAENFHQLENGYLTREVTAVDIEPLKLRHHFLDSGQKYHFMKRREGATVKQAHRECVDFIHAEVNNWVQAMNRVFYTRKRSGRSKVSTVPLRRKAVSHLALALHSLQDSYSPGHTEREEYSNFQHPGAIQNIFIYANQDSHAHSEEDFKSGSLDSIYAKSAIHASSELMMLCAKTIAMKSPIIVEWQKFESRWLRLSTKAY